jgi:hypothetical protein
MLKHHKKIIGLIVLLLLLGGGWFFIANHLTKRLESMIAVGTEHLRKEGYDVSYSGIKFSFNPFTLQATVHEPQIKNGQNFIDWKGHEAIITLHPWSFNTLHFSFPGEQRFGIPPSLSLPADALHVEQAQGTLHLALDGHPESATLDVGQLSFLSDNQPQPIALQTLSLNVGNLKDPLTLKLSLSTRVANIEKLLNQEPREHPFTINFVADLGGIEPGARLPKSFAEWRDAGGVLEVRLLKLDWPPIVAEIEGTLTLDEGLYPLGSFTSRISGYEQLLNDMAALGWIKKKKVNMALFVLELLSSKGEMGEKYLKAPITLQNKVLSVGPAPLLKLKPIGGPINLEGL